MDVAQVIPYVGRDFGGPVIAMAAMLEGLLSAGQQVSVFSTHRASEGVQIKLPPSVNTNICMDITRGALRHSPRLWASLDQYQAAIIHSHGLWTDVHRCAATIARRRGIPHVLGPCGMLEPNALLRSSWKKKLVGFLFQHKALREANCLLANSEPEYNDIRRFGLKNPVAIIPNPVMGPGSSSKINEVDFFHKYPLFLEKKVLLFLGRIHPVKGLDRLVEAWAQLSADHVSWNLVLAGPDEGGYQATVEKQVVRLNCQNSVHFIGSLNDAWKWAVLQSAELFVMPSDFENFGISIAEAMLVGKPVITTTGTPWSILTQKNAGWQAELSPASLKTALREAMELSDQERQEIGARGRVIAEQFTPNLVAKQLVSLYKWLDNKGEKPVCVRLD